LTGDDFSPGTTESQQVGISKVRDLSKRLKKNAGKAPERLDLGSASPVSDSSLTGSAEPPFGGDES